MRKLTYLVASTIDGFIADPSGANPAGPDGFFVLEGGHMQALFSDYPDIIPAQARQALGIDAPNKHFDTVLEGRVSYEMGLREGVTNAYPHLRHYVFSRSMTASPDPGVELVSTDPLAKVRELKREDGMRIWLCGGAKLANALRPEIDELVVKLHPVVAGAGIPLFDGEFRPERFTLAEHQVFDSGVVHLTYVRL
ncbi:dihydrofolate reductase family protein [Amycolatopsis anabasis]|uniref:dihydrofolate reductase family protein n=1 Tax=Amycolatopsis anabasis TaxID=1840409 RepID=UPI00131B142B|nr:dihydrofolate reductase family protein [Amycolatopsis anabasis]